jgi:CheY-like chemotaxis protein
VTRTILIIDDEDDIRAVARMSLEMTAGWRVLTADGGSAGYEQATRERPDAILLDVMMPDLDGPATLERLRAHPDTRAIPVVFLTAKVQAADHRRFATMPVSGVLTKPFDPMLLAEQVADVLGWSM